MLRFKGREWKEYCCDPELKFMLWHPALDDERVLWSIGWSFVPADYDREKHDYKSVEHLYVDAFGYAPAHRDWRELEGMVFEPGEEWGAGPEVIASWRGPTDKKSSRLDTLACMLRFRRREGWKFEVEVSAWFAREASFLWQIRQMCKQLVPAGMDEAEEEEELPDEWTNSRDIYWVGDVTFSQVNCLVPVNAPKPTELAQRLSKHRLRLTDFRKIYVNGQHTEAVTPETGLCGDGRLVIAVTPHF